jgi:hypothetical protein
MRVRVCVDRVSNCDVWITNSQGYAANSFLGTIERSVGISLLYDSKRTNEGWLAAEIGTKWTSQPSSPMSALGDMPTHFAYLKRITPAYWRSEPDSRYLWINSLKKCNL